MPKTLEKRITELESRVAAVEKHQAPLDRPGLAWLERIAGSFDGDEDYKEAMRLGAEYRRKQPKC
jgi:hypothetical protein